jgi:hypothetical protein
VSSINVASGPLLPRLASAVTLRRAFYDAVAADPRATVPAGAIVCLTAMARESVGLWELSQVHPAWGLAAVSVALLALLGWAVYGAFGFVVARVLAPEPAEFRRVLRCLGFAETVTILRLIAFVVDERLYLPLHIALLVWSAAAIFVALRSAAPASTTRLVLMTVPTFVVQQAVLAAEGALAY